MGKDLPWHPAMEGAGKHRFLPSLPSLNITHFADGSPKGQPSFQMGEKCKQQSNLILTRLSISNMVAFTAQVIFQDGSTRCGDKMLVEGGMGSADSRDRDPSRRGALGAPGNISPHQHTTFRHPSQGWTPAAQRPDPHVWWEAEQSGLQLGAYVGCGTFSVVASLFMRKASSGRSVDRKRERSRWF